MSNISVFEFESQSIRFVDGKPVANDVATVLGYADPAKAVSTKVKDKNKSVTKMVTVDRKLRDITVLEEAGIYQLIFSSRLPAAEKFQDWVFEEVLPSIRKPVSYSASK
ncbi:MAG: Bro-N domain-containing protein [Microcystis panniformis]